ncbi:MAG: CRTAC1 family protein [Vicinamibacterales bacterium]
MTRPVPFVLATLLVATLAACRSDSPASEPKSDPTPDRRTTDAWFVDRAQESGLSFQHVNGMTGAYYESEIFAPGVALFDYDNDDDLDAYIVQGHRLVVGATGVPAPEGSVPSGDRLFRNDLVVNPDGTRAPRFTDVTADSGIRVTTYGMGIAAGDVDNDGWTDLYLTRLGPNVLLHNNGDGTFSDTSGPSGTADPSWSVSASFLDFDRDGWLDLYVGNYMEYSLEGDRPCTGITGRPDYCPPAAYPAVADRLYRNRGNGSFTDVTSRAGMRGEARPALGVSTADFNGDGWVDIYVANDGTENNLWLNQGDGTFKDIAVVAGAALTAEGDAEASMGLDAGDFDNDGDEDLVIANLTSEGTTLYGNDGRGAFEDWGVRSGLRPNSLPYTGFGNAWIDVDNDGWLDVFTVNGAVRIIDRLVAAGETYPLRQPRQLFRNLGTGRFEDVTSLAGEALTRATVARGAAFGDVDNDGDVDVLVGNSNGVAELLINLVGQRHHFAGIRVVGRPTNATRPGRDMLGARVVARSADGRTLSRRARSDGSYASANDPRVVLGLGASSGDIQVQVTWPDGNKEEWANVPADRWTTLEEGSGQRVDASAR